MRKLLQIGCNNENNYVEGILGHKKNWDDLNFHKIQRCRINTEAIKVSKGAKIRNQYNQVPHLTQDINGKVTNSQS